MLRVSRLPSALGLLLLLAGHANAEVDLQVGQIWSYEARPGEEASTLTILKIESDPVLGRIVHIRLDGLRVKAPAAPGGTTDTVMHLPFSESSLRGSLRSPAGKAEPLPDFEEGYETWKSAFDEGEAGVFTVPVREAVGFIETTLSES